MWERFKVGDPILLAGIAGSMVALFYTRPLCWYKALCASFGGTGAAVFIAPVIVKDFSPEVGAAVAFLLGIFSMSIIGIVFQILDRIKNAPIKTVGEICNIIIDVLLAFRHGVYNRRKEDRDGN